jgi:hypothetical protein
LINTKPKELHTNLLEIHKCSEAIKTELVVVYNALLMGKIPFAKIGEVRAEQTVFCPVEQLVM